MPGEVLSQDILVQLMLVNIWLVLLLALCGAVCLFEASLRAFRAKLEEIWQRWRHLLGE